MCERNTKGNLVKQIILPREIIFRKYMRRSKFKLLKDKNFFYEHNDRFCITCQRRGHVCDMQKKRCGNCKRLHLKCRYASSESIKTLEQPADSMNKKTGIASHYTSDPTDESSPRKSISSGTGVDRVLDFSDFNSSQYNNSHLVYDICNMDSLGNMYEIDDNILFGGLHTSLTEAPGFGDMPMKDLENFNSFLSQFLTPIEHGGQEREEQSDILKTLKTPSTLSFDILKQHYIANVSSMFSLKNPNWTFYNFIYHYCCSSHPFVMFAICAWSSACLYMASTELQNKDFCHIYLQRGLEELHSWLIAKKILFHLSLDQTLKYENVKAFGDLYFCTNSIDYKNLSHLSHKDLDSLLSASYFLLQYCTSMRSPEFYPLMEMLSEFLKYLIKTKGKSALNGLNARVSLWIAELDVRASMLGNKGGNFVDELLNVGLEHLAEESKNVLVNAYKLIYPNEISEQDSKHFPFIVLHLKEYEILRMISKYDDCSINNESNVYLISKEKILHEINVLKERLESLTSYNEGRLGMMNKNTTCLLYVLQIYYNLIFNKNSAPYSEGKAARSLINVVEKITRENEVPRLREWSMLIFFAMIEVDDEVYLSWCTNMLARVKESTFSHEQMVSFVIKFRTQQDKMRKRISISQMMDTYLTRFII